MKQCTIEEIIPFLKKGWVAMDKCGVWSWFSVKPKIQNVDYGYLSREYYPYWEGEWTFQKIPLGVIKIKPVNDWTKSLIEIK